MPGTEFQFTIRRPSKEGPTRLKARERYRDRKRADRAADAAFIRALYAQFGDAVFERGNLDAGRLNWLLGREVLPADEDFDPASYEARLRLDTERVRESFPDALDD